MVWKQLLLVSCLSAAMFLSMLQEGSSASVGVTQVATGQEPQEGECRAQPGVPGEWASPCGSPSELFLVVTGLFRVSGVKQVFVPESDALNFLRRNGRRSPRPPQEINEENRQHPGANERQVEYYEERQYEYENFAEEQIDEYARSQEANEQWRWRGYNGLYPPYPSDRRRV
ncbi:unique cartilage matrix-associated protein isoform X1 [Rousettus aegyptiacus]|uniref:unique cartilage matrix-associated protein isoform X1 n=1 Tax=Rousettus aegyptiacus TaxID=9407 RepID=UPI00168CE816|nr:unique cartilage matrix-associated protein isoform X1 [Rousettus aegyptiacus]